VAVRGDAPEPELDGAGAIHVEEPAGVAEPLPVAAVSDDALLSFPSFLDSEDFSASLALIGINEDARLSLFVWVDWLVESFTGSIARIIPTVTKNPANTARLLSSNLFL
jgi:hypothetical protein